MTDPQLHVGDHVTDRETGDAGATMLVERLPTLDANEYNIESGGPTVADANDDYPADDDVVEVTFPERTDIDLASRDRYAYPRSRLELETPLHNRNEDEEVDD